VNPHLLKSDQDGIEIDKRGVEGDKRRELKSDQDGIEMIRVLALIDKEE